MNLRKTTCQQQICTCLCTIAYTWRQERELHESIQGVQYGTPFSRFLKITSGKHTFYNSRFVEVQISRTKKKYNSRYVKNTAFYVNFNKSQTNTAIVI